jgi:hypothetical protein
MDPPTPAAKIKASSTPAAQTGRRGGALSPAIGLLDEDATMLCIVEKGGEGGGDSLFRPHTKAQAAPNSAVSFSILSFSSLHTFTTTIRS